MIAGPRDGLLLEIAWPYLSAAWDEAPECGLDPLEDEIVRWAITA
jgi:hypothetical protein